jgi:spermidine synthase
MRGSAEAPAREAAPAITRRPSAKRLRERIGFYFGTDAEIVEECWAASFNGRIAVVDVPRGADLERSLISLNADGTVTRQSTMSLARPDRLVFAYERLMSIAFAAVKRPRRALLLGLGGGAMVRFLAAHLPGCETTAIENDETVIEIARRFFHIRLPVVHRDALAFLHETEERFDVVLVDLYDAAGAVHAGRRIWDACRSVLAPKGSLAVNWADFAGNAAYEAAAGALATRVAGGTLFVTPHGFKDNLVQFAWQDADLEAEGVLPRFHEFERARHLPFRVCNLLRGCLLSPTFPKRAETTKDGD